MMIEQVLREINCFYIRSSDSVTAIGENTLTVGNGSKFVAGQYVYVQGSVLNDGIYRIASVDGNVLGIVGSVMMVEASVVGWIYGLAIPKDLLAIIDEIKTYQLSVSGNAQNIASETLGDYSVTYGGGSNSWTEVYKKRLMPYKHIYLDLPYMVRGDLA